MFVNGKNYRAVVFDLDGTLIETEPMNFRAWNQALEPFGISISEEDYFKMCGRPADVLSEELVNEHNLEITGVELNKSREEIAQSLMNEEEVPMMPGAKEALDYFSSKAVKLALVTSSYDGELETKLVHNGLAEYFDVIVSISDVSWGKPAPDMYNEAFEQLGVDSEEVVVFEDTQAGVESAAEAGADVYAVPHMYSESQDFSKAVDVFENMTEALEYFQANEI